MPWGGSRPNSGRKKIQRVLKKSTSNRGGARPGSGRKKKVLTQRPQRTFQETIDEAERRRIVRHVPSDSESSDSDGETDEDELFDQDYYSYGNYDPEQSSDSDGSDNESDDGDSDDGEDSEDDEIEGRETVRWYQHDTPLNRYIKMFKAQLDDPSSQIRKKLKEGVLRFPVSNPSIQLRNHIELGKVSSAHPNDFCKKEAS